MRKSTFLLLLNLLLFNNISFASFPVIHDQELNQTVNISQDLSEEESVWTKITTKPEKGDFHFGGLLIGFLLGLIGVGLVYLFSKNPAVKRSSWYGLGIWLIVLLASGGFN
ncbi:hypothetical protein N9Y90_02745 [Flavobacteriales bacterium]|nr:hypothetical protein [Flavobacteriales bacterium]